MSSQNKSRMLWVDLAISVKQSELPALFNKYFEVIRPHSVSSLESEIKRREPQLILFDFDYPERPGMKLLEITKRQFPSIALLMMTVQHSEALATWAFRSRVWDFLVKPVSEPELDRSLSALNALVEKVSGRKRHREILSRPSPVPQENRVAPRNTTPAELMPALTHIEKHFRGKVTSADVSGACKMDSFRFSRTFKSAFGTTFKEYLLHVRIKEACRLLEKPDVAVTDVAYLSGFNDPSYFSKVFKRHVGVCPSMYISSTEHRGLLNDERLVSMWDGK